MRIDSIIHFTHCSKYQYNEIFKLIFPDKTEIGSEFYKLIKNKKFTTSILQKYLIKFIFNPEKIIENLKLFDEYIASTTDKKSNMFI